MNPAARAMNDEGASNAVPSGEVLEAGFFDRSTVAVARDLLGKVLVREVDGRRMWGRLVEVEAYLGPDDLASHSAGGRRSPRNEVMYGAPGHAYVYFTYGMHHCLCFVTRPSGTPQAVLVRALEPGPGVGRCGGPGLVCRALEIDRGLNGVALTPPHLYLVDDRAPKRRVVTPRPSASSTPATGRSARCASAGTRRICRGRSPTKLAK